MLRVWACIYVWILSLRLVIVRISPRLMSACIWIQSNKALILDFKSFRPPDNILAFLPQSIIRPLTQTLFGCSEIHWRIAKTLIMQQLVMQSMFPLCISNLSGWMVWRLSVAAKPQLVKRNEVHHLTDNRSLSDWRVVLCRVCLPPQRWLTLGLALILLCCSGCQRTILRPHTVI